MRKQMWKRMVSFAVTGTMAFTCLTGCGSNGGTTTGNAKESVSDSQTANASEEKLSFPLKEKVTLKVWAGSMAEHLTNLVGDYNETDFFKQLEEKTNVHIEFETISTATSATEAYNLMISSGDLPDMIIGANLYSGGLDAAVDDGYYMDLTPYLDTYLSNYNAKIHSGDDILRDAMTDEGRIVMTKTIFQEKQPLFTGLMMRKDWLDADGLSVPSTLDEWENVLTDFKEKHGATAPLALTPAYDFFLYGFNATTEYLVKDNKVIYGPTSDYMKEALTVFADWYKKGLIDPDFMSREAAFAGDSSMIATGQSGVFNSYYMLADYYKATATDPNMELIAVNPPISASGEESKLATPVPVCSDTGGIAVTTQCSNPEVAMMWMDYFYSEEGSLFANYGTEGDTFNYVDGKPQFTDKIVNNADGLTMNQAMAFYTCPPGVIGKSYDYKRELVGASEESIAMCDTWDSVSSDYYYPGANMTSAENTEYASIYSDISTYMESEIASFISGEKDINTQWDEYVATVESLGIDRCVELKQAAYDRYEERIK